MNDIDFIKKCCEYAEGFEIINDNVNGLLIGLNHGTWTFNTSCWDNPSWNGLVYPLLLQRAIEGINRNMEYSIIEYSTIIRALNMTTDKEENFACGIKSLNIDNAKRSALEYVFTQENKQ